MCLRHLLGEELGPLSMKELQMIENNWMGPYHMLDTGSTHVFIT